MKKTMSTKAKIILSNDPVDILKYTKKVICADIHSRKRNKRLLISNGAEKVLTLDEILNEPSKDMSLEKLDEIIRSMEETTTEFKRYKEIYNELEYLQNQITSGINDLKGNKDSLDNLNKDMTESIENLRTKIESLNKMLPEKMLELMTSNKDIQIDIKEKHEEVVKNMNVYTDAVNIQSKRFVVITVVIVLTFIMNAVAIYPLLKDAIQRLMY